MLGLSHGYRELVDSVGRETRWICREEGLVNDLRLFFVTATNRDARLQEMSKRRLTNAWESCYETDGLSRRSVLPSSPSAPLAPGLLRTVLISDCLYGYLEQHGRNRFTRGD
jgi:hypothetical protein